MERNGKIETLTSSHGKIRWERTKNAQNTTLEAEMFLCAKQHKGSHFLGPFSHPKSCSSVRGRCASARRSTSLGVDGGLWAKSHAPVNATLGATLDATVFWTIAHVQNRSSMYRLFAYFGERCSRMCGMIKGILVPVVVNLASMH